MTQFVFPLSAYIPVAIGLFGLGTGYFIWGGGALFGFPKEETPEVSKSLGMWAFWMPGFMQFITGVYLFVGLTWFQVFTVSAGGKVANTSPLYMVALAFTAYGVHWFAMAHRRFIRSSAAPDAWMALAYTIISVLGVVVFILAPDYGVMIVFIGLSLIYISEAPTRFGLWPMAFGVRLVALWQVLTGIWLMYLTWAFTLNLSNGMHLWV